ncbi:alpha/beta hydrolase family protein [Streptomyces endophytica]|uniref:Prolyl oligopeptidase family serine peptidase n=1 Tax=Streptomyces endophytica TaxID=2991496 RepID=A0ABY6PHZ5_9ACTN|nr:prolyl oligopeptidase family serine peptidase [Streptomyces endophytica]UZJ33065.1 prolyl oligopeptidase family serine peptidase [Streptomyces endophytica]
MRLSFRRRISALAAVVGTVVLAALLIPAGAARADGHRSPGRVPGGMGLVRQEVSFRGGEGLVLHGTVLSAVTAQGAPARPGIVLVGGSGPGPREEYRQEAEAFARAGITTLVYDKRTVRYSRMDVDFGLLAEDALAGVRLLRGRTGVDPHHVGLWGFSEGGWVAPLAAARSSDVGFVVTIGGSGLPPLRTQTWNLTTHLRHRGVAGSFLPAVQGPTARLVDSTGRFPEADFDPLPALRRMHHTPVLALWGDHDRQVPPRESARVFRRVLAEAGNRHVVTRFLRGAAHNGHRTSDGFDRIAGPRYQGKLLGALAPGYVHTLASWVDAVASGHPPRSSAAPAPPQTASSAPAPGAWYAWLPPVLLLLGFAASPVSGALRRIARRPRPGTTQGAALRRWLAGLGLLAVTTAVLCPLAVFVVGDGGAAGPVVAGRPLGWLVAQALSLTVVALTGVAAWRRWNEPRTAGSSRPPARTGVARASLMTAAVLFVPWALWWGTLRP